MSYTRGSLFSLRTQYRFTLSKIIWCHRGFVPPPHLRQCIAFYGRGGWLFDIGWFVLFLWYFDVRKNPEYLLSCNSIFQALAGVVMNVIAILVLTLAVNTWGNAIFSLHTMPDIFKDAVSQSKCDATSSILMTTNNMTGNMTSTMSMPTST